MTYLKGLLLAVSSSIFPANEAACKLIELRKTEGGGKKRATAKEAEKQTNRKMLRDSRWLQGKRAA